MAYYTISCFCFTLIDKTFVTLHHMNSEFFHDMIEYVVASLFRDHMIYHIFYKDTKCFHNQIEYAIAVNFVYQIVYHIFHKDVK